MAASGVKPRPPPLPNSPPPGLGGSGGPMQQAGRGNPMEPTSPVSPKTEMPPTVTLQGRLGKIYNDGKMKYGGEGMAKVMRASPTRDLLPSEASEGLLERDVIISMRSLLLCSRKGIVKADFPLPHIEEVVDFTAEVGHPPGRELYQVTTTKAEIAIVDVPSKPQFVEVLQQMCAAWQGREILCQTYAESKRPPVGVPPPPAQQPPPPPPPQQHHHRQGNRHSMSTHGSPHMRAASNFDTVSHSSSLSRLPGGGKDTSSRRSRGHSSTTTSSTSRHHRRQWSPPPVVTNPFLRKQVGVEPGMATCERCGCDVDPGRHKFCTSCGLRVHFAAKDGVLISRSAPLLSRIAVLRRHIGDVRVALNDPADELDDVPEELKDEIISQQQQAIAELKKYVETQALLTAEQALQLDQLQIAVADDLSSVSDTTLMLGPDSSPSVSSAGSWAEGGNSEDDGWGFASQGGGRKKRASHPKASKAQQREMGELQECIEALTHGTYAEHLQAQTKSLKMEVAKLKKWAKMKRKREREKTKNLRAWVDSQARGAIPPQQDAPPQPDYAEWGDYYGPGYYYPQGGLGSGQQQAYGGYDAPYDNNMSFAMHPPGGGGGGGAYDDFPGYADAESDYADPRNLPADVVNAAFRRGRQHSVSESSAMETPTSRPMQRAIDKRLKANGGRKDGQAPAKKGKHTGGVSASGNSSGVTSGGGSRPGGGGGGGGHLEATPSQVSGSSSGWGIPKSPTLMSIGKGSAAGAGSGSGSGGSGTPSQEPRPSQRPSQGVPVSGGSGGDGGGGGTRGESGGGGGGGSSGASTTESEKHRQIIRDGIWGGGAEPLDMKYFYPHPVPSRGFAREEGIGGGGGGGGGGAGGARPTPSSRAPPGGAAPAGFPTPPAPAAGQQQYHQPQPAAGLWYPQQQQQQQHYQREPAGLRPHTQSAAWSPPQPLLDAGGGYAQQQQGPVLGVGVGLAQPVPLPLPPGPHPAAALPQGGRGAQQGLPVAGLCPQQQQQQVLQQASSAGSPAVASSAPESVSRVRWAGRAPERGRSGGASVAGGGGGSRPDLRGRSKGAATSGALSISSPQAPKASRYWSPPRASEEGSAASRV